MVLYGHNVTANCGVQLLPKLHLSIDDFENTIQRFQQLGVVFISMERLIEISNHQFKNNVPWIHLTFDDGYRENLTVILPILRKYAIPFTVFVSSNHILAQRRFYTYRVKAAVLFATIDFTLLDVHVLVNENRMQREEKYKALVQKIKALSRKEALATYECIDQLLPEKQWGELDRTYYSDEILTVAELKELAENPLVHIGSHCHNHVLLNSTVAEDEIEFEMRESQDWLFRTVGYEPYSFCYPNGTTEDYTQLSVAVSERLSKIAFTTVYGFVGAATNTHLVPRLFLLPDCTSLVNEMVFPEFVTKWKNVLRSLFSIIRNRK